MMADEFGLHIEPVSGIFPYWEWSLWLNGAILAKGGTLTQIGARRQAAQIVKRHQAGEPTGHGKRFRWNGGWERA